MQMLGIMFMVILLNRFVPLHRFPRVPKTSVPHDLSKVSTEAATSQAVAHGSIKEVPGRQAVQL
jgi:hypothetical protein